MEKIKSLPANYIFQAVDARQIGMMERFYRAADVDALLADVRRLVEAAKTARTFLINRNLVTIAYRVDMQIAAVERHLATSPPHSSPPPEGNGKA